MKSKTLEKIFLAISLVLLVSCGDKMPPLVTITQLDTVHNKANPFKITKYNTETCNLELEEMPSITLMGPEMHGAFCLSAEDAAKYKAHFQSECKNNNQKKAEQRKREGQNVSH